MNAASRPDAGPIIPGFHPDPTVCRVGDDYYLACSSFEYFPGVPIFHSRDLVGWTQIGNALDRPSQLNLPPTTPSSGGIYAPTLRHHDGRFWLITSNIPHGGTLLFNTEDPAGEWSDPVRLPDVPGIDPDLAWDDDGVCWCTFAGIGQVRIDPRDGSALEKPRRIWSGTPGATYPEAPHLYRIGDLWYLLIAEGGTERGHGISVARGPAPNGPFEPCPANPILTHRGTDDPVQNTGHGDLVQAPDGSWWLVFLGVRPRGGSPGWHVLGRETFLAPVDWVDGWPVVGAPGTLPAGADGPGSLPVKERDDFDEPNLHPRWISIRNRPAAAVSLAEQPGWLTLRARGASLDELTVTFVGRRQQHHSVRVGARVDAAAGRGGLAVRLDEQHHYAVELTGGRVVVRARVGPLSQVLAERAAPAGPVVLGIRTLATGPSPDHPRQEPDVVQLGYEHPRDGFVTLAELDGRYLSTEVGGGFTGRVIGMYATEGTVRVDWYEYERLDP
ncbi:glycoside hydrolase family 43 protein [Solwaraspora sp. WMMD1047]|uniref:glycoside hydrolase family 43 protein n=1 Tax=Solwaraspora sp. WMMD1047 TaxID=3016102 RepID=UPI002416C3ED|nr:glycoside hydrolase family 43 protein [Solwaraspora sp. WMMD1047]MDG4831203.1 glycoside hydrolase family 43 protein [Solwaraspora sp. WMMD1047]